MSRSEGLQLLNRLTRMNTEAITFFIFTLKLLGRHFNTIRTTRTPSRTTKSSTKCLPVLRAIVKAFCFSLVFPGLLSS